jgi:hypothetical protein
MHHTLQAINNVQVRANGGVEFRDRRLLAGSIHPRLILAMDTAHGIFERAAEAGMAMRFDDRDADETLGFVGRFRDIHGGRMFDMRRVNLHPVLIIEGDDISADRAGDLLHASAFQMRLRRQSHHCRHLPNNQRGWLLRLHKSAQGLDHARIGGDRRGSATDHIRLQQRVGASQWQFPEAADQLDGMLDHSWHIGPMDHGHEAFRPVLEGIAQQRRRWNLRRIGRKGDLP